MDHNHTSLLERELIERGFRGELIADCPLAPYTTWRIGGAVDLLVSPSDRDDLLLVVERANALGIGWRILGNGSNLLVHDDGVRGVVIRLRKVLDDIRIDRESVRAGAGALFPSVANRAAAAGLAGLEFAAGIPGTVGGAVIMNAGWHEYETGKLISRVEWIDGSGTLGTHTRTACGFRYRGSGFRDQSGIVLSATFDLMPGDAKEIRARLEQFSDSRKQNQPTELPSCGSVFLKPPGDFAGRLIEQAGLKGERVGDAQVSRKHANFIVNVGQATCDQVLTLVRRIEQVVEGRFGVHLVREFEVWE